jgi:hypothetical protein
MKQFFKNAATIASLLFVFEFVACEQAALNGPASFDAGLSAAKGVPAKPGITAPPTRWAVFNPLPFGGTPVDMVRGLASDGAFLVAAGSDGTNALATRFDTVSGAWTRPDVLPGFTVNPGAAHYLYKYFLVTGGTTSSYGAYSPNGDIGTWTQTGLIGFGTKAGVYGYEEELYVVAGQNGQAAYSYNPGVDFITIPNTYTGWVGSGNPYYINTGAYGDGVYVFGGASGRIAYTNTILSGGQPVTWSTALPVAPDPWPFGLGDFVNVIVYGGVETFVAVGNNAANNGGIIAYSTNGGQNWENVDLSLLNIGTNAGIYALTFGDGYFVAVDNEGNSAWSIDGINWNNGGNSNTYFNTSPRVNAAVFYEAVSGFVVGGTNNSGVQVIVSNP